MRALSFAADRSRSLVCPFAKVTMSTLDPNAPHASSAATATPPEDASPPEVAPAPEPWTPERALEWNRYYDRYLVAGLILLVFLVSAHKITNSTLWPLVKAGEVMVQKQSFLTTDPFSYTEEGKRWVNIPWIYELASHAIYSLGSKSFSRDPSVGQQIGAGLLVALNAVIRALTVVLLLRLRKPGPGVWWFCTVLLFAMGIVLAPRLSTMEFSPGGIARQPLIMPETWGVLLLAAEILLLERAYRGNAPRALVALVPLFLFWANVDESFLFGLLVLIAGVCGFAWNKKESPIAKKGLPATEKPTIGLSAGVVAGCVGICLVNPSLFHIFPTALEPYVEMGRVVFGPRTGSIQAEQFAFFGSETFSLLGEFGPSVPWNRMYYYLTIVGVGFASFLLNARRFDAGRFAVYLVAALLWGGLSRLTAEFATVFVFAVGLNGQEWYQDRFGTEGRTSTGWSAWSVGGRAITILVMFLAIAKTLTGYGYDTSSYPRPLPPFGFGTFPSEFDFEAAEFLKTAPITGKVLNLHANQGDAIIWKGYPAVKTFLDRRRGVFGPEVRADLIAFRKGFSLDESDKTVRKVKSDPEQWQPIVKKYGVSAVMLDPLELPPAVYEGLLGDTAHFIPIYDDGRTVIFGYKDASAEDVKFFESKKLDAAELVYKRKQELPSPDLRPNSDDIPRSDRAKPRPDPAAAASFRRISLAVRARGDGQRRARRGALHPGDPRGEDRAAPQSRREHGLSSAR